EHAAVVATGRSDYPNQINNVLAFPGLFRGLLDARARSIDDEVLRATAVAIAGTVSDHERNASFIIPSVVDPTVAKEVACAVVDVVHAERAAAGEPEPFTGALPLGTGEEGWRRWTGYGTGSRRCWRARTQPPPRATPANGRQPSRRTRRTWPLTGSKPTRRPGAAPTPS